MNVRELRALLKKLPQDLEVANPRYSEYVLLETDDLTVTYLCLPRADGWLHSARPDKESKKYLVIG